MRRRVLRYYNEPDTLPLCFVPMERRHRNIFGQAMAQGERMPTFAAQKRKNH
jgi:hypothetical protein